MLDIYKKKNTKTNKRNVLCTTQPDSLRGQCSTAGTLQGGDNNCQAQPGHRPWVLVSLQKATSQSSSSPTPEQLQIFNHHQLIWGGGNKVRVDQANLKKLNET